MMYISESLVIITLALIIKIIITNSLNAHHLLSTVLNVLYIIIKNSS